MGVETMIDVSTKLEKAAKSLRLAGEHHSACSQAAESARSASRDAEQALEGAYMAYVEARIQLIEIASGIDIIPGM